jgi:surface polysaccharide O-acyltransferase-like enzyme
MERGTIKIHSSFYFMQLLLYLCRPIITIDGGSSEKRNWGDTSFEVSPGQHTVHVETSYFFRTVAKATTTVTVGANETVAVRYRVPWLVLMSGKLKVV